MYQAKYVYNRKKDRPDPRDLRFKAQHPATSLPKNVDDRHWFSPIRDQDDLGSCSAFSSAGGAFEMLENKALLQKVPLDQSPEEFGITFSQASTMLQYQNTLLIEGNFGKDEGAEIRDAVKALAVYGVCQESAWPYDLNKFTVKAPQDVYDEAAKHKISQYARIADGDINSIKAALARGLPVICGIMVFEGLESDQCLATGNVPMPNVNSDAFLGGHAICLAGYLGNSFIFRNSWGADVGDKGYFYIPEAYLASSQLSEDFWVITK